MQPPGVHGGGVLETGAGGEGRDRVGIVAGEHLERDALLAEPGERRGDVGSQLVGERHHGQGVERWQHRPPVPVAERPLGIGGPGEEEDSQALCGPRAHVAGEVRPTQRGRQSLRRPEHPRRVVGTQGAPAQRGAERHLLPHRDRLPGESASERRGGQVGRGGAAGHRPQRRRDVVRVVPADGRHLGHGEAAGGERAGLVGADDVDVAHRLHGVDPLHERTLARAGDRAGGVGQRDEEEQAVGDQARQHRGGLHDPQQR